MKTTTFEMGTERPKDGRYIRRHRYDKASKTHVTELTEIEDDDGQVVFIIGGVEYSLEWLHNYLSVRTYSLRLDRLSVSPHSGNVVHIRSDPR